MVYYTYEYIKAVCRLTLIVPSKSGLQCTYLYCTALTYLYIYVNMYIFIHEHKFIKVLVSLQLVLQKTHTRFQHCWTETPGRGGLNTTIIIWINLFSLLYCWHTYKLGKFDPSYLFERPYWLANYSHVQRFLLNLILCVQICFKLRNHNYTSEFTKFKNYELKNNSACS